MNVPRGSFEGGVSGRLAQNPRQTDCGGQLTKPIRVRVELAEHLPDVCGDAPEVAILGRREHVKHRLHVVVVDDHWRVVPLDVGEIAKQLRLREPRRDDRRIQ